ncbi:MAG: KpsF/GutQ family sugar-phosphate isomerase [Calditrichaeota bacterium]|nr:KpsF/GutQ family sugar-phosphate isomerase [Calditrichota bacterium]
MNSKQIIEKAIRVFDIEISGLKEVRDSIDESFVKAVQLIYKSSGKVIVTGMGKSGRIAEKVAATLSSVGTPAVFMHPSEAAHGDLGLVSKNDVMITIGKSGESEELLHILPVIRKLGIPIISLLGNLNSKTAQLSDICISTYVSEEACDLKLAPTSSTTASLVMGDAIAMVLRELKQFKQEDFALFHPSGQLGKRLLLKVEDVMRKDDELPVINENDSIENLVYGVSKYSMGVIGVVNQSNQLLGLVTDGDLRRAMMKFGATMFDQQIRDLMTKNPLTISKDISAYDAFVKMEKNVTISNIPVVENNRYIGMINLHDLIKMGLK